jgi:hypothetical protein
MLCRTVARIQLQERHRSHSLSLPGLRDPISWHRGWGEAVYAQARARVMGSKGEYGRTTMLNDAEALRRITGVRFGDTSAGSVEIAATPHSSVRASLPRDQVRRVAALKWGAHVGLETFPTRKSLGRMAVGLGKGDYIGGNAGDMKTPRAQSKQGNVGVERVPSEIIKRQLSHGYCKPGRAVRW